MTDRLEFSFVCPLRFEDLDGDGAIRHCRQCRRDVTDLRGKTMDEIKAFLRAERSACIVAEVDHEGRPWLRAAQRVAQAASFAMVAGGAPQCREEAPTAPPVVTVAPPVVTPPSVSYDGDDGAVPPCVQQPPATPEPPATGEPPVPPRRVTMGKPVQVPPRHITMMGAPPAPD